MRGRRRNRWCPGLERATCLLLRLGQPAVFRQQAPLDRVQIDEVDEVVGGRRLPDELAESSRLVEIASEVRKKSAMLAATVERKRARSAARAPRGRREEPAPPRRSLLLAPRSSSDPTTYRPPSCEGRPLGTSHGHVCASRVPARRRPHGQKPAERVRRRPGGGCRPPAPSEASRGGRCLLHRGRPVHVRRSRSTRSDPRCGRAAIRAVWNSRSQAATASSARHRFQRSPATDHQYRARPSGPRPLRRRRAPPHDACRVRRLQRSDGQHVEDASDDGRFRTDDGVRRSRRRLEQRPGLVELTRLPHRDGEVGHQREPACRPLEESVVARRAATARRCSRRVRERRCPPVARCRRPCSQARRETDRRIELGRDSDVPARGGSRRSRRARRGRV